MNKAKGPFLISSAPILILSVWPIVCFKLISTLLRSAAGTHSVKSVPCIPSSFWVQLLFKCMQARPCLNFCIPECLVAPPWMFSGTCPTLFTAFHMLSLLGILLKTSNFQEFKNQVYILIFNGIIWVFLEVMKSQAPYNVSRLVDLYSLSSLP
uniref:Uncharacterized protein n=1 Tax=Ficedula albicollis TaxID=59894 RepID=A0A803V201_FICAL